MLEGGKTKTQKKRKEYSIMRQEEKYKVKWSERMWRWGAREKKKDDNVDVDKNEGNIID